MASTTLYLIRHGKAHGNGSIILGSRDVPLDRVGHSQAYFLAKKWKHTPDAIVSSPLKRAVSTAMPMALKYDLEIINAPLLIEGNCGKYEGRCVRELMRKQPSLFFHLDGKPIGYMKKVTDGRTWEHMVERAGEMLAQITSDFAGKTVLAFTHQGLMYAALCAQHGLAAPEVFRWHIGNTDWLRFDL